MGAKVLTLRDWDLMKNNHYAILTGRRDRLFEVEALARTVAPKYPVFLVDVPGLAVDLAVYREKEHAQARPLGALRLIQLSSIAPFIELRAGDSPLFYNAYSNLLKMGLRLQERSRG